MVELIARALEYFLKRMENKKAHREEILKDIFVKLERQIKVDVDVYKSALAAERLDPYHLNLWLRQKMAAHACLAVIRGSVTFKGVPKDVVLKTAEMHKAIRRNALHLWWWLMYPSERNSNKERAFKIEYPALLSELKVGQFVFNGEYKLHRDTPESVMEWKYFLDDVDKMVVSHSPVEILIGATL